MAKTKLKTKKAAAKRFKVTGSGKVLHESPGMRHNLGNKSSKKKRLKGNSSEILAADMNKVRKMLKF